MGLGFASPAPEVLWEKAGEGAAPSLTRGPSESISVARTIGARRPAPDHSVGHMT